jgi:hypothetical protein
VYFVALAVAFVLVSSNAMRVQGLRVALATNSSGSRLSPLRWSLYQILRLTAAGRRRADLLVGFGLLAFAIRDVLAAFGAAVLSSARTSTSARWPAWSRWPTSATRRHVAARAGSAPSGTGRGSWSRELLLRDLHGIGALISNIRMPPTSGRRTTREPARRCRPSPSFGQKSSRAFVQTLDDDSVSWERQVAELRRQSGQASRSFEMDVTRRRRPPTTQLAPLAIFGEGLTNAPAPSRTYVRRLSARPDELCLTMKTTATSGAPGRDRRGPGAHESARAPSSAAT